MGHIRQRLRCLVIQMPPVVMLTLSVVAFSIVKHAVACRLIRHCRRQSDGETLGNTPCIVGRRSFLIHHLLLLHNRFAERGYFGQLLKPDEEQEAVKVRFFARPSKRIDLDRPTSTELLLGPETRESREITRRHRDRSVSSIMAVTRRARSHSGRARVSEGRGLGLACLECCRLGVPPSSRKGTLGPRASSSTPL